MSFSQQLYRQINFIYLGHVIILQVVLVYEYIHISQLMSIHHNFIYLHYILQYLDFLHKYIFRIFHHFSLYFNMFYHTNHLELDLCLEYLKIYKQFHPCNNKNLDHESIFQVELYYDQTNIMEHYIIKNYLSMDHDNIIHLVSNRFMLIKLPLYYLHQIQFHSPNILVQVHSFNLKYFLQLQINYDLFQIYNIYCVTIICLEFFHCRLRKKLL